MKKVLAVLVALMMVFSFTVSTMAASFVQSPSNNMAPELIEGECGINGCVGKITIISFGDREKMPDEDRIAFEGAYNSISNADDLTTLNLKLEKLVKEHGIDNDDLSVSDLFFVDSTDNHSHDGEGNYSIKLKAETLKNFVGLLRFDGEKWHWVDGASVEGNTLMFNTKEIGSFAIVVDKGETKIPADNKNESSKNETVKDESSKVSSTEVSKTDKTEKPQSNADKAKPDSSKSDTPKTGESNRIYLWIMLFAVSAILIIFVAFKRRKNNES